MLSRFRYILLFSIVLFSSFRAAAQLDMPDNVCIGAAKHYFVDPNPVPGSTYTWRINGVTQVISTTNEIDITWNTSGTYLLEVQELSIDGCPGPLRSGQVFVSPLPTIITSLTMQPSCTVPTGSVVLSDLPAGNWTINPGSISGTGSSTTISDLDIGTYNYTVTNADGCTSVASANVVINAQPSTPSAPTVSSSTPGNVCPVETINLTSLITSVTPVGGSIFYKTNNDPLGTDVTDPTVVGTAAYYIFYQNQEGCYSTGTLVTVTIIHCPPDLTPTLIVNPNIMHGITNFNVIVQVTELNMVNTNGLITVNIPKDSRWFLTNGFVQSLTIIGTTPLNNSVWTYSSNATNHIFTTTAVIPKGGSSTFGFRVTFNPGSTKGVYTITSQIVSGSGGESRVSNNADAEKIDYFHQ